jgi:cupin 2 domain-containing protein
VFVGHYGLSAHRPEILAENVACLDFSVAKGGFLCAYRWQGEQKLSNDNFVWVSGGETAKTARSENQPLPTIQPGRYRHYKGKQYTVIGVALHSETKEELVVYRQQYGDHALWVRPKEMFLETVKVDGREVPRFQSLGSKGEKDGEIIKNLFDDLPQHLPKELVQTLILGADVRIERIISHGHASPEGFWYDQGQHEWVIVLKGAAKLRFEDGMIVMKPGDFVNIPAFKKHRVDWTTPDEPTVWLGVRYGEKQ